MKKENVAMVIGAGIGAGAVGLVMSVVNLLKSKKTDSTVSEYENKMSSQGIYYSRYIASWENSHGYGHSDSLFKEWLESVGLGEDEIEEVVFLRRNGKMELENSVNEFLKTREEN